MDQETEQQEQQGPAPVAHRSNVPQIEVVNEIQILNRKDNNQRSLNNSKTKSKDKDKEKSKDKEKDSKHSDKRSKSSSKASNNDCGNNSKYKIKEPDPDETSKKAKSNEEDDTKKPSKKTSIGTTTITSTTVATPTNGTAEKATKHEKNNAGICVCGKLLKRVKGILEGKDKKVGKQEEEDITVPVRYYPESLQALCKATRFSEEEIKRMYRGFKAECPNGLIKEENFKNIYSQFFPFGASSAQYAHYVFNSIDRSLNGTLSFEEFVLNLSILSRGTVEEKLNWTFQLYDVNGDGFITKNEMQEVITAVYELMGKIPEGCKEENQIKEKVENLFKKMDHNMDEKISLDEFMDSCRNDDSIRSSITVFQTIF